MSNNERMWRNLAEYQQTPEFEDLLAKEFPQVEAGEPGSVTRRRFVQLMGASFALAGVAACRWEAESIMPYARRPEGMDPGSLAYFRSGMELGGSMYPLEVETFALRPSKIHASKHHPFNAGGTDSYAQASILGLFDPDRSTKFRRINKPISDGTSAFSKFVKKHFGKLRSTQGEGLRVLANSLSSPSWASMKERFLAMFPKAGWVEYESLTRDNEREGARMAFGTIKNGLCSIQPRPSQRADRTVS